MIRTVMNTVAGVVVFGLALVTASTAAAQDRLPGIPWEKLTAEQKKALTEGTYAKTRPPEKDGTAPNRTSARYLVRIPEVMPLLNGMVDHINQRSVLGQRLSELIVLLSASEHSERFIWGNHVPMANKAGLSPDIIAAIAEGRRPAKMAEDEAIVYDFVTEVNRTKQASDATFARMVSKFGEAGVVEAVNTQGIYAYMANLWHVMKHPLDPGMDKLTPALVQRPVKE